MTALWQWFVGYLVLMAGGMTLYGLGIFYSLRRGHYKLNNDRFVPAGFGTSVYVVVVGAFCFFYGLTYGVIGLGKFTLDLFN